LADQQHPTRSISPPLESELFLSIIFWPILQLFS
jgi:hypothetical protein